MIDTLPNICQKFAQRCAFEWKDCEICTCQCTVSKKVSVQIKCLTKMQLLFLVFLTESSRIDLLLTLNEFCVDLDCSGNLPHQM